MNIRLHRVRTPLIASLIVLSSLMKLPAQSASGLTDNDDDTAISYSFPMLRMTKGAFVDLGSQGIRCPLTLTNVGDGPLVIQSFEWDRPGDYSISSSVLPNTIQPGEEKVIEIRYTGANPINNLPYNALGVTSNSRPVTAFSVVLDVSRSMILDSAECRGQWFTKLEIAKDRTIQFLDSALLYVPELGFQDEFTFVTYSIDPKRHIHAERVSPALRTLAKSIIDTLNEVSGTYTGRALIETISSFAWNKSPRRIIVLITDGQTSREDRDWSSPSRVVIEALRSGVSIFAVSVTPKDSAITRYLDSITVPTGGLTTTADNCTKLGAKLNQLSIASHLRTKDWEPFPTGRTLSAPLYQEEGRASIAITDVTPNPASEYIEITLRSAGATETELMLYNTLGELIEEPTTQRLAGSGEHTIRADVRSFPAGVYVAVVSTAEGPQASRAFTLIK